VSLYELEENIRKAHVAYLIDKKTNDAMVGFIYAIKSMALRLLNTDPYLKTIVRIERTEVAYDHAIRIFREIDTGNFSTEYPADKFPWITYIKLSINTDIRRHMDFDIYHYENINKIYEESRDTSPSAEERIISIEPSDNVMKLLRMFYTEEEINRYYPIARDLLGKVKTTRDKDIRRFVSILSVCARRATREGSYNYLGKSYFNYTNVVNAVKSTIRSSIFLSLLDEDVFGRDTPKEFFLSLDMSSLIRLCTALGGTKITIPDKTKLSRVLTSIEAIQQAATEDIEPKEALKNILEAYKMSGMKPHQYYSMLDKCLTLYASTGLHSEVNASSIEDTLLSSSKRLKTMIEKFSESISERSLGELIKHFSELDTLLKNLEKNRKY